MTPTTRLSQDDEGQDAKAIGGARCDGCFHFAVCKVPGVMGQMMTGLFPPTEVNGEQVSTSPIDPMAIAEVCSVYTKATGVLTA